MLIYIILILLVSIFFIFLLNNRNIEKFSNTKIPKIIIQTWKDENIPEKYIPEILSIKKNNPDYKYLFFTDNDIEKFIIDNYPQYYETYLKLPVKIQKIDFFRYIAIYHFGGFYMDLDMHCYTSFDNLLDYDSVFPQDMTITDSKCEAKLIRYLDYCNNTTQRFLLGQYAFAAKKNNPFIKALIDNIVSNLEDIIKFKDNSYLYIYKTTGPDYVTDVYLDWKDKESIHILRFPDDQCFGRYAVHNHYGTWK